jgi:filamentous hemagglutinin family protein
MRMKRNIKFFTQWGITCCLLGINIGESVFAQSSNIVTDNSLGAESSVVTPLDGAGLPIDAINGGAIRGINLFHSFKEFNVSAERSAYFFIPTAEIQNILTRVTGKNPSEILGTLGTIQFTSDGFARSNANLFLLNPNGIIFGQNSRLDVGGSFFATTANAIEFGNQGLFSATNPQIPQLLTVNPSAFFLNQIPAAITNKSSPVNPINRVLTEGLVVDEGKNLLLLGGDINFDGGVVFALGGKVEIAGLAGIGRIGLNIDGNNLDLNFPENIPKANITLTNNAAINNYGINGAEIRILGNNITISGNSSITGATIGDQNSKPIFIKASQLTISDLSAILTLTSTAGNSGDIFIDTENLSLQNTGILNTFSYGGQGKAGNIYVRARNSANLDNVSILGTLSLGAGNDNSTGSSGDVFIDTKNLNIQNLSGIAISSFLGQGNPGNLTLKVADSINLSNSRISTASFNAASGGNILIETGNLNVTDGSQINNSSLDPTNANFLPTVSQTIKNLGFDPTLQAAFIDILQRVISRESGNTNNFGQGNSGNLDIRASESIVLRGTSPDGQINNTISAETQGAGKAGNLNLATKKLIVQDGSAISTQTLAAGDGGNLNVNADSVELASKAQIIAQSEGTGKAGNINLNAQGQLTAINADILTSSVNSSGGTINIKAKDIRLFSDSNIRTNVFSGAGGGGDITLTANFIIALNDSDILSFSQDGKGGDIRFNTSAFFSSPLYRYTPASINVATLQALDRNNSVDVNASGAISGTISGVPDISFLQNSLTELPRNLIDTNILIANSCIARRSNQQSGSFYITGSGGLAERPGDAPLSAFNTGVIQSLSTSNSPSRRWKLGDPIWEAQGVYRLANGQRILSRLCGE